MRQDNSRFALKAPSPQAMSAARAIRADESGKDGFEPWTPCYLEHVARIIERVYGR